MTGFTGLLNKEMAFLTQLQTILIDKFGTYKK